MTTREVLVKAREMMATPGGWTYGTLQNYNDSVCAIGAISMAAVGEAVYVTDHEGKGHRAFAAAVRAVGSVLPSPGPYDKGTISELQNRVVSYNDSQGGPDCVLAAFDAAIAKLDKQSGTISKGDAVTTKETLSDYEGDPQ